MLLYIPSVVAFIFTALFLHEIREAGVNPEKYPFGTELGPEYESQEAYISVMKKNALYGGLFFVALSTGAFYLSRRKKP